VKRLLRRLKILFLKIRKNSDHQDILKIIYGLTFKIEKFGESTKITCSYPGISDIIILRNSDNEKDIKCGIIKAVRIFTYKIEKSYNL